MCRDYGTLIHGARRPVPNHSHDLLTEQVPGLSAAVSIGAIDVDVVGQHADGRSRDRIRQLTDQNHGPSVDARKLHDVVVEH